MAQNVIREKDKMYPNYIEYIINKKKRTVTAILKGNFVFRKKKGLENNRIEELFEYRFFDFLPDTTITATAKCDPEDVFLVETGKKLAYDKVMKTFYKCLVAYRTMINKEVLEYLKLNNQLLNDNMYDVELFENRIKKFKGIE